MSTSRCCSTGGCVARRGWCSPGRSSCARRGGGSVARCAEGHRVRVAERVAEVVELDVGQVVEVRP